MELPDKIKHILSADKWYHATTKSNFENILSKGVIADHNRFSELDFGYGFYLTTSEKLAESFISRLFSWQGNTDNDPPIIMEYKMSPLEWFTGNKYNTTTFPEFDDSFAEFVFENRMNSASGKQLHNFDAIYGVMSDSVPTKLLLQYRAGEITREKVIEGLKKGNSMKQISLHSQDLCDIIKLERAYQYDPDTKGRKEGRSWIFMSEKALQVAKNEILRTIKAHFTNISEQEAIRLSDELLDVIDWNNPALMHKSISWITKSYLQNRVTVRV